MELEVLREMHFRELRFAGKSEDTVRFYRQSYKEILDFLGQDHPAVQDLNKLTRADLYGMMGAMQDRGCIPGSVHAIMRGCRAIFNWAHEQEHLEVNPMEKVKLPSVPRKLQKAVQPEQAQKVIALCEEDGKFKSRNRALVAMLYDTGLRLSEIASLDLSDVDLKNATVFVQHGKGGHSRTVPIGNTVIKHLVKYLRDRKPALPGEQRLWIGRDGQPFTKWGIVQVLDSYAVRLNIDRAELAPHAWRRGFAVQYLRNGGELFALQQLMGHTNLEMTRKYVNYLPGDLKKTHNLISPMDRLGRK